MCEAMFFSAYVNKAKVEEHTLHLSSKVVYFSEFFLYLRQLPKNGHVKSLQKQRPTL